MDEHQLPENLPSQTVGGQQPKIAVTPLSSKNSKSRFWKWLIILALIILGLGSLFFYAKGQNWELMGVNLTKIFKTLVGQTVEDPSFKNSEIVWNKLKDKYKTLDSWEIKGNVLSYKKDWSERTLSTSFNGKMVWPDSLSFNSTTHSEMITGAKGAETTDSRAERIVVNGKIFTRRGSNSEFGQWDIDYIVNPLEKIYEQKNINTPLPKENFEVSWLLWQLSENLSYLGKEGDLYRYQIIPKNLEFYPATDYLRRVYDLYLGEGFGAVNALVEGEVWINSNYDLVKEKYFIAGFSNEEERIKYKIDKNEGVKVEINYSNYNQKFTIFEPVDTADLDTMWKEIEQGKDEMQAEANYRKKLFEKRPDLAIQERDNRRFLDMMISLLPALDYYYERNNVFPSNLADLKSVDISAGAADIQAPTPPDGDCTEEQNKYIYTKLGPNSYKVTFCMGGARSPIPGGFQSFTEKGINCLADLKDKPYYCFPREDVQY